jgi:2-polyprenyl-3-methyl-5-hydroxy-6-metoxy-1,4-benzoquinol methylase
MTVPRCPVCTSVDTNRYCHKDTSEYFACTSCQALFQHPVPDRQAMLNYAETEYAEGVYGEYVGAREMKLAHFAARMDLMRPRVRVGTLLDVGCSCGYFMEVAMREGFEVRGLEFSQHAIDAARPEVRARIIRTSVNELSGEHEQAYDVITAFDIIEHLERPLEFLQHARRLLRPGGVIVISTPDADHWLRPLMGARWPMLQPMQHLTIFSRKSMRVALDTAGFQTEVIETAHKILSYDYLINQVRPLNPLLFSLLRGATRVVPAAMMRRQRQVNIGEVLAIARQVG